ncbi:MAG: ABC transporter ATP-binding protein [Opitutae bacterium]
MRNLSKGYGPVLAVHDLSLAVMPGEIFGLLGLNGAGKTTTLECILGLRQPDTGTITLAGINAKDDPVRARQQVGAVLQSTALQEKLTPRQALRFYASFYPNAADPGALLEYFDLVAKADEPFAALSGGQQQRLFLALAFINQPEVVILDEPTAGLDPRARREMHQLLLQMKAEGRAVLLSTHDLEEAQKLCDRIGILHAGRLIAVDSPAALLARAPAVSRIIFRTVHPLVVKTVAAWPGVIELRPRADGWQLVTREPNALVVRLAQHLEAENNPLLELSICGPSLEDVFLDLTGRAWSGANPPEPAP